MTHALSRSRWMCLSVAAVAASVALLISLWGLAGDRLRPVADVRRDDDAASGALRYLLDRPFDPAGWLAWVGSAAPLAGTTAPPALAVKVVDANRTLAPVDPQVLRAQALVALRKGEIAAGLELVADIAALFPAERGDAFTTLGAYLGDAAWSPFLASRLDRGWAQVDAFVLETCNRGAGFGTLIGLVQQIVRKQPLADDVVACVGNRAIAENAVPAAYWVWLNASRAVPRTLGNVFNGDFELAAAGRLFDWRLSAGGEYREGFVATVRSDDTRGQPSKVLAIRFNGRPLRLPIAQQYLALAPGRYALTYQLRTSSADAPASVGWSLKCVPPTLAPVTGQTVAEQRNGGWISRRQEITIPSGCSGQLLDLEVGNRLQMLQGLQGTILFDDISIVRL
jgi:hypothetical protein